MDNEEKLFQQKQSLETLFLLMKKTRAKKFKVIIYKVCSGGFLSGGFLSGVYVLIPHFSDHRKPKQTDVIVSCFVSLSLVSQGMLPRKN